MTWALRTALPLDEVNLHLHALEAAGLLGIVEEDGVATAYLPQRCADLAVDGVWERVPDVDWNAAWKAGIRPVTVGAVTIVPPWLDADGDIVLRIEPGQAFGTGHHETTTGCLAALQELDLRGRRVLDVGTGTGVLAIAAARLGAGPVVAVDSDPLAVAAATANSAANATTVTVLHGSADGVAGTFDVVVANLDTATLVATATNLTSRLVAGGVLIAAGVAVEHADEASTALGATGLSLSVRPGHAWALLLGRVV